MRRIFYPIMQIAICLNLQAQNPANRITERDLQSFSEGKFMPATNMDALYEGVKGTPYFNEEWLTGDVYFPDGTEIIRINIRYNIYSDELEFKNSTSGQTFIIDRNRISGFRFNEPGDSILFESFNFKPDTPEEKSFVQILYNGKTRFLLKHRKQFIPANYQGAYATGNKYDEYQDDKDYYLIRDDGSIEKIKLNRKSVMSALKDSQSVLKEFALNNKIDFTNPKDIIKILLFHDNKEKNR
jgi:hypothetical protein